MAHLRVEGRELEAEARGVLLDVEENVEDAQALILPRVGHLLDPALVQQGVHGRRAENLLYFKIVRIKERVHCALNVQEVGNFLGLEQGAEIGLVV